MQKGLLPAVCVCVVSSHNKRVGRLPNNLRRGEGGSRCWGVWVLWDAASLRGPSDRTWTANSTGTGTGTEGQNAAHSAGGGGELHRRGRTNQSALPFVVVIIIIIPGRGSRAGALRKASSHLKMTSTIFFCLYRRSFLVGNIPCDTSTIFIAQVQWTFWPPSSALALCSPMTKMPSFL